MPTITVSTSPLVSSFKGITNLNNGNFIAQLKGTAQQPHIAAANALDNIQLALRGLNKSLDSAQLSFSVPPQSFVLVEQLVAASGVNTITHASPVNIGDVLYVFVEAAGTGASFVFDTNFRFATNLSFDSTNATWTVIQFVGMPDPVSAAMQWFRVGIPLTGVS